MRADLTFQPQRQSRRHELHDVGGGGHALIEPSLRVAKGAPKRRVRYETKSDFVRHKKDVARKIRKRLRQKQRLRVNVASRFEKIGQPQGQAIDHDALVCPRLRANACSQIERRFKRPPRCITRGPMMGNARRHLRIAGFGRRDKQSGARASFRETLRPRALARPRTAKDQGRPHEP